LKSWGCYSGVTNGERPPHGMGSGEPPWPSRPFACNRECQRDDERLPALLPRPLPINTTRSPWGVFFFSVLPSSPPLAPPLAATAVKPSLATQLAPASSPHPRASIGPIVQAFFSPESPHHPLPCPTPAGAPPPSPSRGQTTPAPLCHPRECHRHRCELLILFLALI
jgi:hypothetical protein